MFTFHLPQTSWGGFASEEIVSEVEPNLNVGFVFGWFFGRTFQSHGNHPEKWIDFGEHRFFWNLFQPSKRRKIPTSSKPDKSAFEEKEHLDGFSWMWQETVDAGFPTSVLRVFGGKLKRSWYCVTFVSGSCIKRKNCNDVFLRLSCDCVHPVVYTCCWWKKSG